MIRSLLLVVLLVGAVGCGKGKPPAPQYVDISCHDGQDCTVTVPVAPTPPSHEAQVYAELWRIAKERHLTFQIQDMGDDDFMGSAHDAPGNWWFSHEKGPTESAESLIKALSGKPWRRAPAFDTGEIRP